MNFNVMALSKKWSMLWWMGFLWQNTGPFSLHFRCALHRVEGLHRGNKDRKKLYMPWDVWLMTRCILVPSWCREMVVHDFNQMETCIGRVSLCCICTIAASSANWFHNKASISMFSVQMHVVFYRMWLLLNGIDNQWKCAGGSLAFTKGNNTAKNTTIMCLIRISMFSLCVLYCMYVFCIVCLGAENMKNKMQT
jgi:hypothetical protein